jgi:hypothetical protein
MSASSHRLCQDAELVPEHIRSKALTTPPPTGKHHRTVEAHPPKTQDFAQRSG